MCQPDRPRTFFGQTRHCRFQEVVGRAQNQQSARGRRYYRNRSGIVILESLVSVSVSILENFKYQYQYRNRHSLISGTPLNDFGHFIKIFVIKLVWLWYQYRNRNRNWYFSWYQYQYRNRPDMGKVSVSKSVSKKLVSPAPAMYDLWNARMYLSYFCGTGQK